MKKIILQSILILGCIIIQKHSFAQTNVSGTLTENTTWTVENSPYKLTGDVVVPYGVTLSINPGVIISSDASGNSGLFSSYKLTVEGEIKAIGEDLNNITIEDTEISFQEANLTNSNFEKVTIKNFGSLLTIGNKNIGTLNILNSTFKSSTFTGTLGYDTSSKIVFKNCKLSNSNIGKHFGGNDSIEIWDSEITDTNLSMSWSSGSISLFNSEVINSRYTAEIDGFFHIDSCTIIESEFSGFITGVSIMNSNVVNSSFFLYDHLKITNSEVSLTFKNPSQFSRDHQIRSKSVELTETQFDGNNLGKDGVYIFGSKNSIIKNCSFKNFRKAIVFDGTSLEVNTNNFLDIEQYVIENLTQHNINAQENYWGTINEDSIGLKIYDQLDNGTKGLIDFSNFLEYPTYKNIPKAPKNVLKGDLGQKTLITWEENEEATLEGYKVYKKNITTNEFDLIADVGNVNSFEEIIDIEEEIYLTAYAIDTATETKGQIIESNFSKPAKPFFEANYPYSTSICKGSTISVVVQENYEFNSDNFYMLQLSSVSDSFANPVILDT
uniref:hypothetical protein n=1 Tax=Flexithrix dorotheae TaxID=70993 RepID=UPI0005C71821